MNIQEMHIGVGLGIQKVNSNAFDSFIDEEIDYYLNKAQREYVRRQNVFLKDRLENLSRPDKISSSEARENLGRLIANANSDDPYDETSFSNAVSFTAPSMFQYLYANARVNGATGPWVSCKLISPYDVHIYSNSEHNKPLFREIPLLIAGDKFILFKDSRTSSIEELEVFYISRVSPHPLGSANSDLFLKIKYLPFLPHLQSSSPTNSPISSVSKAIPG